MPCLRGIELSLVTGFGSQPLQEYPHPDASSIRVDSSSAREKGILASGPCPSKDLQSPTAASGGFHRKSNPRVSVYVSSTPENEFRLRYALKELPPPSPFLFFKLLINGRQIVSWGFDTAQCNTGTVAKALYQPTQTLLDGRTTPKPPALGIESRYFHFAPGHGTKSAAEDGGLIEVRVFRCTGRRRAAPMLAEYRGQEHYGIASPSGGLVDDAKGCAFYDYLLLDAKDSPYATFLFHYRSQAYLQQLNLIHPQYEELSSIQLSRRAIPIMSRDVRHHIHAPEDISNATHPASIDHLENTAQAQSKTSTRVNKYAQGPTDHTDPSATFKSATLGRPSSESFILATIEAERARDSEDRTWQRTRPRKTSRSSSMRSSCPSLTSSLLQYVDTVDFLDEDIQISTAQSVAICSRPVKTLPSKKESRRQSEDSYTSEYASSISSSEAYHSLACSPEPYAEGARDACGDNTNTEKPVSTTYSHETDHTGLGLVEGGMYENTALSPVALNIPEAEWLKNTRAGVSQALVHKVRDGDHQGQECALKPCSPGDQEVVLPSTNKPVSTPIHSNAPLGNWI